MAAFFIVFCILIYLENLGSVNSFKANEIEEIIKVFSNPFNFTNNVSEKCFHSTELYLNDLKLKKRWAWQMYDSSSKISSGILTGNTKLFGNYDECLDVETEYGFSGQACIADIEVVNSNKGSKLEKTTYEWMWCMPSTCNYSEVLQHFYPVRFIDIENVEIKINKIICHSKETDQNFLTFQDWVYIGIIILFLTITLLGSYYDIYARKNAENVNVESISHMLLTSFSLFSNANKLISTRRSKDDIDCLNGIRFLSICWIIFGHTYYVETIAGSINLEHITKLHGNWFNILFLNSNVATDTFLLISATLLVYTLLLRNEKYPRNSINFMSLYIYRYLRLTPVYAMLVGFYATLFRKLGSGPSWDDWVVTSSKACETNWWTNLLYINNFINVESMCILQSWYLAVDMQLFWFSGVFLYPLFKFRKNMWFLILLSVGFVVSILVPFLQTYIEKLPGTMIYYKSFEDTVKVYKMIYIKPYARAGPYIVGIILGLILFKTRFNPIRITKLHVTIGWFLTTMVAAFSLFGARRSYFVYNRIEASCYSGFHRHGFALCVSWIVFTCVKGYSGLIGKFLAWPGWLPFSRLTYSVYLSHYGVLLYYGGSTRTPGNLTTLNVMRTFFGNLSLSLLISAFIYLIIEVPFVNITGKVMDRTKSATEESTRNLPSSLYTAENNDINKRTVEILKKNNGNNAHTVEIHKKTNGNNAHLENTSV